ncbi:MAG: S-adenosylmethionine decarboxylase [Planctomycetota bacterium]|nr:S-adenosylmethionine decarboxylase [Planctomycetota bacterium]
MKNTETAPLICASRDVVFGSHLVADYRGVSPDLLNSPDRIIEILEQAALAGDATVVDSCIHQFSPYGVTATVTLAEIWCILHSWRNQLRRR